MYFSSTRRGIGTGGTDSVCIFLAPNQFYSIHNYNNIPYFTNFIVYIIIIIYPNYIIYVEGCI